ncbi:MAG: histidine kinase [Sphingobium sp.]|uniref:histidine kinase n=1 Tax=Sphingobium sp. TaxID=1912891 RepID=UPI0029A10F3F|nr:histidine kinase [Sphingobium sp.]MDX3910482.1 histidine kinase [Sphingobium sp.]
MRKIPQKLLCTCAMAVVMGTVAAVLPLQAQGGFQGNVTSAIGLSGNNPFISRGETSDVIGIRDTETIIDWQPYDNDINSTAPVDFLPDGNDVRYEIGISATISDYTVLNRINPSNTSRIVTLDGQIRSVLNDINTPGGSVWFYTPGGFAIGANAVINVGSLVLTSNPITTTGGLFDANGAIRFRGPANSTSAVQVGTGAQITAGNYIALVAPRIEQGGTVSVNGSAAYIGAEQADIVINGGLFDINILAGTTDSNGVVHTGSTTGPASTAATDVQRIAMVAVPKNNALTMLLSGAVGYPAAAALTQEGSAIILSAGYNLNAGDITDPVNTVAANMTLGGGTLSSRTYAEATGTLALDQSVSPTLTFGNSADLKGGGDLSLDASAGSLIQVQGDLTLDTYNLNGPGTIKLTALGGPNQVGTIDVTGNLTVNLSNEGVNDPLNGGNVTGGSLTMESNGGLIRAQSLMVDATSYSGVGSNSSGNATAGSVDLTVSDGGILQFATTAIDASAAVNRDASTSPVNGGNATGGSITFTGNGGTLDLGVVTAKAQASAGTSTSGIAGDATSGNIVVDLTSGTHNWTSFNGDITAANGFSVTGLGTSGATGPGLGAHRILIDVSGSATLNLSQSISLYAEAYSFGGSSAAGTVRGGTIGVQARDGGTLNITRDLFATANVFSNNFSLSGDVTGDMLGGNISVGALGGTFRAAGLNLSASAVAGQAGITAGSATGGSITLAATRPDGLRGNLSLTDCATFGCALNVFAAGAQGANGSSGTGGTILAYTSDADMAIGALSLSAEGQGGAARQAFGQTGTGGEGIGGTITIESRRGTLNNGTLTLGQLFANASGTPQILGEYYNFNPGDAGAGSGGTVTLGLDGGTFSASDVELTANGFGAAADENCLDCTGGGTNPFRAGTGAGGAVTMRLAGANATLGSLTLSANGTGGEAQGAYSPDSIGAIAGIGRGGTASLEAVSGQLTVGTLTINANGLGGTGSQVFDGNAADGGSGVGGTAQFVMEAGTTAIVNATNLTLSAAGTGGLGGSAIADGLPAAYRAGTGGDGTGGTVDFQLAGGTLNTPTIFLSANGEGGNGGENETDGAGASGGAGIGGSARLAFQSEGHNLVDLTLSAAGRGGQAGTTLRIVGFDQNDEPIYDYGIGAGGNGGSGTGGLASLAIDVDPVFANLTLDASGAGRDGGTGSTGGAGGAGTGGINGMGANLAVNFGTLTVANTLTITAGALGGDGGMGLTGVGGDGGIGTGGEAGMIVSGGSTLVQTNMLDIYAGSLGGDGGASGTMSGAGLAGASGGMAIGGAAGILVADNATLELGQTTQISAATIGGTGFSGTSSAVPGTGGRSGAGGDATGGTARFVVQNATVTSGTGSTLAIDASAAAGSAFGVSDGGQGGPGGSATGGIAQIEAAGSAVALNTVLLSANALGGTSINGAAIGNVGGNATGGNAAVNVSGGGIVAQLDALALSASALGGSGGASSGAGVAGANGGAATGGRVRFGGSGNSQTVLAPSITLIANATGGAGGAGATGGTGGNGGIGLGGTAQFAIDSAQARSSGSGTYSLSAHGTGGNGGAGGDGTGGLANFEALNADFDLPAMQLFANGSAGDGGLGGISGNGTIPVASGRNGFATGGIAQASNGGGGSLASGGLRRLAGLIMEANGQFQTANGFALGTTAGRITITDTSITAGGGLIINGTLNADALGSPSCNCSGIFVNASGNPIQSSDAFLSSDAPISFAFNGGGSFRATNTLDVQSRGTITVMHSNPVATGDSLFGSTVALNAAGDVLSAAGTTLRAANAMTITSGNGSVALAQAIADTGLNVLATTGTASVSGQAVAQTIKISSADIVIGSGARLGAQGTTRNITLSGSFGQQGRNYIGGGDQAGAYSLSGDEMTRLFAQDILIALAAQSTIGSFTLTSGTNGNLGPNGTLTVQSQGRMEVVGAIRLTGLGTTGGLTLSAGNGMDVFTDTASIDLRGAGTTLGGVLTLDAPSVAVATRSAITDITGFIPVDTRNERLSRNDGNVSDEGFLRAGAIAINGIGVYIQNSGAGTELADRRGFTTNRLTLTGGGPDTEIVINGRLVNNAGGFITGAEAIRLVSINGVPGGRTGDFSDRSTVNGCLILAVANCTIVPPVIPEIPPVMADNRDAIERILDPAIAVKQIFPVAIVELRDFVAEGYPPLIDEPVTGAGNEDLWDSDCSVSGNEGCGDPVAQ